VQRYFCERNSISFSSKIITQTAYREIRVTSVIQIYQRRLKSKTDDTTKTTVEQSVGEPTTLQFSLHAQSTLSSLKNYEVQLL